MPSTGFQLAGTGANVSGGGSAVWANPNNITDTDDASFANGGNLKSSGSTQYLHATNFGFSIPAGAEIVGIEARFRILKSGSGNIVDNEVQAVIGGSRTGSNLADTTTNWPSSATNRDYGGASNLWGLTPSRAQVVASDFGVSMRAIHTGGSSTASPRVISVWINVYYELPPAGAFFALFSVADRLRDILKPKRRFWLPEPTF